MDYDLLDKINFPSDLREFKKKDLKQISEELRAKTIETVSKTGGHLGAGLGVVELTVAIHYVFNTPHDKLIWDVGHQAYPHKNITGRKKNIDKLAHLSIKRGVALQKGQILLITAPLESLPLLRKIAEYA